MRGTRWRLTPPRCRNDCQLTKPASACLGLRSSPNWLKKILEAIYGHVSPDLAMAGSPAAGRILKERPADRRSRYSMSPEAREVPATHQPSGPAESWPTPKVSHAASASKTICGLRRSSDSSSPSGEALRRSVSVSTGTSPQRITDGRRIIKTSNALVHRFERVRRDREWATAQSQTSSAPGPGRAATQRGFRLATLDTNSARSAFG